MIPIPSTNSNSAALCLGGGEGLKSTDKDKRLISTVGKETPETQSISSSDAPEAVAAAAVGVCHPSEEGGGGTMKYERGCGLVDGREELIFESNENVSSSSNVGESGLRIEYEETTSHGGRTYLTSDDSTFAFRLHEKKPSVRTAPFTCMTLTAWFRMMWVFRKDVKWWTYKWPILFTTFICILTSLAAIVEEVLVWWWPTVRGHIIPVRKPVFILGHYRSGTTIMHQILSQDEEQFTFTSNRHCVFPSTFVVMKAIKCLIQPIFPKRRPMDNVLLDLDLPQEDEYAAMLLSGGISPFLQLFFLQENQQKILSQYGTFGHKATNNEADVDLESSLLQKEQKEESGGSLLESLHSKASKQLQRDGKRWHDVWCKFLQRVFYDQKGKDRRLILKSPSHTSRIPILLEMFPDAQFIFVHRNPYEVFQSTAYMIPNVNSLFCLTDLPTRSEVVGLIMSQYLEMHRSYFEAKSLIPPGNLVEVRYSNFMSDPMFEMERIYSTLGFKPFPHDKMQQYMQSQEEGFKKNPPYGELPIELRCKLRSKWTEVIETLGYNEELDLIDYQLKRFDGSMHSSNAPSN